jgi:hypothetical protein
MIKGLNLKETIDFEGLIHILDNIDTIVVPEERVKFKKYANEILNNDNGHHRMVRYSKVAHGYGRLYADGALSMQGFSRGVRKYLAGNIYHDIDIENCHPILLAQICERHGWEAHHLNHYNNNREDVLKSIGRDRNEAKKHVLIIMYGGKMGPITEFKKEMDHIADLVNSAYPHIPGRDKYSRMSLLLQDIENQLLMEIAAHFTRVGYQIGVYVFDGLMLYKRGEDSPDLRKCEESLSWKVKLVEKK